MVFVVLPWRVAPVSGAPTEVVQPSDGRASLLESIRNAGGIGKAKLRNVKERKMEKKKQKEQEQGGGGGRGSWRCDVKVSQSEQRVTTSGF